MPVPGDQGWITRSISNAFRGPLDLLLYLVKRDEVDICDIPIARITEQFHEHLRVLQHVIDVERAGDFMVMAATLMEIKSKMLLPRAEETAAEEADPRLELVRQLMEYKQFKDAAVLLESRAEERLSRLPRQPLEVRPAPDAGQQPLASVELWDLVSAFGRLMRETLALQPKQIVVDETPIHIYMERILALLDEQPRLGFDEVFCAAAPPGFASIGLFLALLELIKAKQIQAEQERPFAEIRICKYTEPASELTKSSGGTFDSIWREPAARSKRSSLSRLLRARLLPSAKLYQYPESH